MGQSDGDAIESIPLQQRYGEEDDLESLEWKYKTLHKPDHSGSLGDGLGKAISLLKEWSLTTMRSAKSIFSKAALRIFVGILIIVAMFIAIYEVFLTGNTTVNIVKVDAGDEGLDAVDASIVALVFYGRRQYVEILDCYLRRNLASNGGTLDEVRFVLGTEDQDDLEWVYALVDSVEGYSTIELSTPAGAHNYQAMWLQSTDPDAIYVKIDDDMVRLFPDHCLWQKARWLTKYQLWLDDQAIPQLVCIFFSPYFIIHGLATAAPSSINFISVVTLVSGYATWGERTDPANAAISKVDTLVNHPAKPVSVLANLINSASLGWIRYNLGAVHSYLPELDPPSNSDEEFLWSGAWRASELPKWNGNSNDEVAPENIGHRHRWLPVRRDEETWTPIERTAYDAFGPDWTDWRVAAQKHYSFLEDLETGKLDKYNTGEDGTWNLHGHRGNINLMAIRGGDVRAKLPFEGDDEQWFSVGLPARINRRKHSFITSMLLQIDSFHIY